MVLFEREEKRYLLLWSFSLLLCSFNSNKDEDKDEIILAIGLKCLCEIMLSLRSNFFIVFIDEIAN